MIFYSSSTETSAAPSYMKSGGAGFDGSETKFSAVVISTQPHSFYILEVSPSKNEALLGFKDSTGRIYTQFWDGAVWQLTGGASQLGGDLVPGNRHFDISYYENDPTYNRAITVYGRSKTSSTTPLAYRIWYSTSSSWSSETTLTLSNGIARWVRMETQPGTNKMIFLASIDVGSNIAELWSGVWDGTGWTLTQLETTANFRKQESGDEQCFDLAFEQNSKNAMAVWVDTNTQTLAYSTWTESGGWGSKSLMAFNVCSTAGYQRWVKLASKPNFNEITAGVSAATDNDLSAVIWNGSSWDNGVLIEGSLPRVVTNRNFDLAYERKSGDALIMYMDGTQPPKYQTRASGSINWLGEQSDASSVGSEAYWIKLVPESLLSSDDIYMICNSTDSTPDIIWQKWSGNSWGIANTVETNSRKDYEIFGIAFFDTTSPSDIANLTASNTGLNDGEIKLEWTAPGDDGAVGTVAGYLVKYSSADVITTDGFASAATYYQTWNGLLSGGNAELRISTGFTPGTTYWFAIQGYDEAGHYGVWYSSNDPGGYNTACSTSAQDLDPQVPQGLSAVSGENTQINLSWTANTDIDFNRYELVSSSWSQTEGFSITTVTVSTSYYHTEYLAAPLVTNNTYYYKLRAMDNTDHYSAYSSTVSAYPAQVPPAQPTGFDGLALATGTIKWSWTDNATNEDGYRVKSDTDGVMGAVSGGTTNYTEGGLSPNTSYYRYAEAYNSAGTSSSSAKTLYTLPTKPGTLQAISVTTNTVSLSWSAGAGGAYRYGLANSTDNFNTNISSFVVFGGALTANTTTVYNLLTGTTYYFRAWAYNPDGRESAWDGPVSTRTEALINYMDIVINEIMYNPQGTEGYRDWVEIYNRSGRDINLTGWRFFDGDGTGKHEFNFFQGGSTIPAGGYVILVDSATVFLNDYANNASSKTWIIIDTVGKLSDTDTLILYYSDLSTIVSSVTYSKTWNNNVEGKSIEKISPEGTENDPGNWQESSDVKGTPGARNSGIPDVFPPAEISDLTAITGNIIDGTIRLEWTAPGDDGVTGILGSGSQYKLWASTNPVNFAVSEAGGGTGATNPVNWQEVISTSSVSPNDLQSYTVTGLFPGTTYYFAVRTKDPLDNWSIWLGTSPEVNIQSYAIAYDTHPAKPTGVVLSPGYKQIFIDWDDNTETDLLEYHVYFGSNTPGIYDHAGSPTTTIVSSITLTGLTNFSTYYIAVKAVDVNGLESDYSEEKSTYPALSAASWVSYQAVSGYTDRIYWEWNYLTDASNGYRVYSSTGGSFLKEELNQSTTYWTETNLDANTPYSRYVRGVDPDLIVGYKSQTVSRYTFAEKPENLSSSQQTEDSITLTWEPPSSGESPNQYKIERDGQEIATVSETTYKDTGLSSWREYAYRVKSLNGDSLTDAVSITEYLQYKTTYRPAPKPERKFITPGKEIKFGTDVEEVKVFDRQGNEIIKKNKGSGSFITWDGKSGGNSVGSGAYIYQLKTKDGKRKYGTLIIVK